MFLFFNIVLSFNVILYKSSSTNYVSVGVLLLMFAGNLGCKSKYFFLFNIRMQWNYFGFGHGKEEHDGTGAAIKRALTSSWIVMVLSYKMHMMLWEWLTWKMSNNSKNKLFIEVQGDEMDRTKSYGCKIVKYTCNTHCVLEFSHKDTTQLLLCTLSCFCSMCTEEAWDECINLSIMEL